VAGIYNQQSHYLIWCYQSSKQGPNISCSKFQIDPLSIVKIIKKKHAKVFGFRHPTSIDFWQYKVEVEVIFCEKRVKNLINKYM